MSFFSNNPFYDLLDKATSEDIPGAEEDIVLNLDIADLIKSKKIKTDDAVNAIKKKLENSNPNVQLLAIKLLDCCIKNSGNHFLVKVSQKGIVDSMATIIRSSLTNPELKKMALTYFQNWAIAFRTKPDLYYLPNVYNELKREGYRFPAYKSSEVSGALIDTETAPEWSDSSVCMRCRVNFTTFNRKHHCRNCGDTFCNACCNKRIPLPKLGITEPVRVCETCYFKVNNPSYSTPKQSDQYDNIDFNDSDFYGNNDYIDSFDTSNRYGATSNREDDDIQRAIKLSLNEYNNNNNSTPKRYEATSNSEDDDIKRAIELSLKEAENNNNNQKYDSNNNRSKNSFSEEQPENSDDEEEQLRRAIEASLKEVKISENTSSNKNHIISTNPDELLTTEIENIKLFSQLMEKINAETPVKGFQAINDTQIQALHAQISSLHPKVMKNKVYYEEKYKKFNDIHEKLVLATRLYDQILSQRLVAARPGSIYSSLLYPSSTIPLQPPQQPKQQQPYAYNPYSLPPNGMTQPGSIIREGSVGPNTQRPSSTYLNQYPSYSTQPSVPSSSAPLSTINYSQTQSQPQLQPQLQSQAPIQTQLQTPPTQPQLQVPTQPQLQAPTQPQLQAPTQSQLQAPTQSQLQTPTQPQLQPLTQPQYQAPNQPQLQEPSQPLQVPPSQVPQAPYNNQNIPTYGNNEYIQSSVSNIPYVPQQQQQPYLSNAVPEVQQSPYAIAPAAPVQQTPPAPEPQPVEEKPLIEL